MIAIKDLSFDYPGGYPALKNIDLEIHAGESIAIIGANGSGKTTLARCLNGLLQPRSGQIEIDGLNTRDEQHIAEIRRRVGMVFQNPDDQLITTTVEAELAFGLENLALPRDEISQRVEAALRDFDLASYRDHPPHRLSGGEKQRLAIAAASAMQPRYLVLDEPTSLLDPQHRHQVGELLRSLNQRLGITTILITQLPAEAALAERLVALYQGSLYMQGPPRKVFANGQRLRAAGLDQPLSCALSSRINSDMVALDLDELAEQWPTKMPTGNLGKPLPPTLSRGHSASKLTVEKLNHSYDLGLPSQRQSLSAIEITISEGSIHALVGPSGSGKTTLAQHFNALLKPSRGRILLDACDIWTRELIWVRRRVGLVFQFPELQLFAETIAEDVAFGPRNMGYDEARTDELVKRALAWVDLPHEHFGQRNPLALSGGERRRAALAGVLAMNPEVLVLDEPTAGLDPRSTRTMCQLFKQLADEGKSLVLITHDMDIVAQLADYVTVLNAGKISMQGPARQVLTDPDFARRTGLNPPTIVQLANKLQRRGIELTHVPLHVEEIDHWLS